MRKPMILLAALALLALTIAAPAAAQQSNWSLVLLDTVSGGLLRVSLDGTQTPIDLSKPADAYVGQKSIDFTDDGSHVAYCTVTDSADGAFVTLYAKAVNDAAPLFSIELGKSDGCWITYSRDGSQIAAGVVRHYPGDPSADPNIPTWQLLVFDAASGQQLYEVNPVKNSASFDAGRALMPEVRYFAGDLIVFAGIPWGTEGFPISPAYLWQTSSGALQPVDRWWRGGWDTLAFTGELTWVELDPNLPAAEPGGPVSQGNVVKLADDGGNEVTVYADPDWIILDTKFIDNGRQLAIQELQAFDPNSTAGQAIRWIALDRTGQVTQLASSVGYSQVAAAPDGYAILQASDSGASPTMTLEYQSGRETTTLWQQQTGGGANWMILWAQPVPPVRGLTPFPAIHP